MHPDTSWQSLSAPRESFERETSVDSITGDRTVRFSSADEHYTVTMSASGQQLSIHSYNSSAPFQANADTRCTLDDIPIEWSPDRLDSELSDQWSREIEYTDKPWSPALPRERKKLSISIRDMRTQFLADRAQRLGPPSTSDKLHQYTTSRRSSSLINVYCSPTYCSAEMFWDKYHYRLTTRDGGEFEVKRLIDNNSSDPQEVPSCYIRLNLTNVWRHLTPVRDLLPSELNEAVRVKSEITKNCQKLREYHFK